MGKSEPIRCRMVACDEALGDGKMWSFYLINDSAIPLDFAVLYQVEYEWGDWGDSDYPDARVTDLVPGGRALLWRGDDSAGEFRSELSVHVGEARRELLLEFRFPKLFIQELKLVNDLGKPGWEVAAKGRRPTSGEREYWQMLANVRSR